MAASRRASVHRMGAHFGGTDTGFAPAPYLRRPPPKRSKGAVPAAPERHRFGVFTPTHGFATSRPPLLVTVAFVVLSPAQRTSRHACTVGHTARAHGSEHVSGVVAQAGV
jgi:hypothetical protein